MSDLSITTSSVIADPAASIDYGFMAPGVSVTAGMTVYKDVANNVILPASNTSAVESEVVGIALHAAAGNQPIAYITAGDLTMTTTPALGVASVYVLGNGTGTISPTLDLDNSTGTRYGTVVGIGVATNKLRVGLNASDVQNP